VRADVDDHRALDHLDAAGRALDGRAVQQRRDAVGGAVQRAVDVEVDAKQLERVGAQYEGDSCIARAAEAEQALDDMHDQDGLGHACQLEEAETWPRAVG
jgi:hypothetical protein